MHNHPFYFFAFGKKVVDGKISNCHYLSFVNLKNNTTLSILFTRSTLRLTFNLIRFTPAFNVWSSPLTSVSASRLDSKSHVLILLNSLTFQSPDSFDDENILGAHLLWVHNLKEQKEFNRCFRFDILCCTSPENLRKSEQFYIDKLKSVYPFWLNNVKSISGLTIL